MLQDSILFPAALWRDSMKDSSCEKTVVHTDIKKNGSGEIIFKLKWSFLRFAYAWQMSDEIVIAQIYSTAWAMLIIKMFTWMMFKLEGHVDLTNGKWLSKQSWKGRCQQEGVPARVAGSATTRTKRRAVQFQGLGEDHKLRRNSIYCSRK